MPEPRPSIYTADISALSLVTFLHSDPAHSDFVNTPKVAHTLYSLNESDSEISHNLRFYSSPVPYPIDFTHHTYLKIIPNRGKS